MIKLSRRPNKICDVEKKFFKFITGDYCAKTLHNCTHLVMYSDTRKPFPLKKLNFSNSQWTKTRKICFPISNGCLNGCTISDYLSTSKTKINIFLKFFFTPGLLQAPSTWKNLKKPLTLAFEANSALSSQIALFSRI